jgi:hypothetical protein
LKIWIFDIQGQQIGNMWVLQLTDKPDPRQTMGKTCIVIKVEGPHCRVMQTTLLQKYN